ncbi:MAG: hypothetical protein EBV76_09405, partial [Gammaproteobacteria bacterium]|nr:hypothetical protein [Gammaproteobacteria bacterium]
MAEFAKDRGGGRRIAKPQPPGRIGAEQTVRGVGADFGALDVRERGNTVAFTGTLEVAYRACLESRVA